MRSRVSKSKDAIFFPFIETELGNLDGEAMAYRHRNYNVWDLDDAAKSECRDFAWTATGRLIIYAHGTGDAAAKHLIGGGENIRKTAPQLARNIREMGFPTASTNEIVMWSCHSGIIGGFAQLLALHLINEGYTNKRIWGCKRYGGTIDADDGHLKAADTARERPHRATDVDARFFIGVGPTLASVLAAAGTAAAGAGGH